MTTEAGAALIGAAIGALAGLAGGGFAALASIRSSQLAARVPLAAKIHDLNAAIVKLRGSIGTGEYVTRVKEFNIAWNDFIVHQKILAPSSQVGLLSDLVLAACVDTKTSPDDMVVLAGDAMNAVTEIVSQQSAHLFHWRALRAERQIVRQFRAATVPNIRSPHLQRIASELRWQ